MKRITDYYVYKSLDFEVFHDFVRDMISNGWQPYGELVVMENKGVYNNSSPFVYFQAFVKIQYPAKITSIPRLHDFESK